MYSKGTTQMAVPYKNEIALSRLRISELKRAYYFN